MRAAQLWGPPAARDLGPSPSPGEVADSHLGLGLCPTGPGRRTQGPGVGGTRSTCKGKRGMRVGRQVRARLFPNLSLGAGRGGKAGKGWPPGAPLFCASPRRRRADSQGPCWASLPGPALRQLPSTGGAGKPLSHAVQEGLQPTTTRLTHAHTLSHASSDAHSHSLTRTLTPAWGTRPHRYTARGRDKGSAPPIPSPLVLPPNPEGLVESGQWPWPCQDTGDRRPGMVPCLKEAGRAEPTWEPPGSCSTP